MLQSMGKRRWCGIAMVELLLYWPTVVLKMKGSFYYPPLNRCPSTGGLTPLATTDPPQSPYILTNQSARFQGSGSSNHPVVGSLRTLKTGRIALASSFSITTIQSTQWQIYLQGNGSHQSDDPHYRQRRRQKYSRRQKSLILKMNLTI